VRQESWVRAKSGQAFLFIPMPGMHAQSLAGFRLLPVPPLVIMRQDTKSKAEEFFASSLWPHAAIAHIQGREACDNNAWSF
jgi:hypothetical protein